MNENSYQKSLPLLAYFKTGHYFYIYDVPTNEILSVYEKLWKATRNREFWELLTDKTLHQSKLIHKFPDIKEADLSDLTEAENSGLFSMKRPESLSLLTDKEQCCRDLESKVGQLTLCITEQCNFRCNYCIYSGHYPYQRQHSNRIMSFETACAAVDFYFKHSYRAEDKFVGFYGGEPTLNFSMIKKIVNYIENVKNEKVTYSITTNGYKLSDEVLRFFIHYQFNMLVSLDGPAEIHDRFRKNSGGKGTFERIYETLHKLRDMNDEYFTSKVRLSVVIGPPYNIKELKDFFDSDSLLKDVNFTITGISATNTTFFESPEAVAAKRISLPEGSDYNSMMEEYKQNLVNGTPYKSRFLAALFEDSFVRFHKRHIYSGYPAMLYANGICMPGVRRIFVSQSGEIHICEKVDDSTLIIGDVFNGFDYDKIFGIIEKYINASNPDCLNCFANRYCSACFATCFSGSGFHKEEKFSSCEQIRNDFISTLADYCEILEADSSAFEFAKNIVFS